MNSKKLYNIEFIRGICAIGIICFHFACYSNYNNAIMLRHKNGVYGDLFVTIFFVLSGGMLYLNNSNIDSLKKFYYKRFKAIYPSFYIAFIVFFMINVVQEKMFFYGFYKGIKSGSLILSLLGVDGYFMYAYPNYYLIGEWFLGAIVLLYFLYPFIVKKLNVKPLQTSLIVLLLFLSVVYFNVFVIHEFRNLFSCLISFYAGMLLFKYDKILKSKIVLVVASLISVIMFLYKLPISENLSIHIMGISVFIVLYWIGILFTKPNFLRIIFVKLGGISYQIFLLQHKIILRILYVYNPADTKGYWEMLAVSILITLILAALLAVVTKLLLKSEKYKAFEDKILKETNM